MTIQRDDDRLSAESMRRFRRVAARFATGVAVVTSVADDLPVGMTVNAFATVSLDPTLLLVCLRHGSRLLSSIERSATFAVTLLAEDQRRQARWFANRTRPTGAAAFAGFPVLPGPVTGCLVLGDGVAYFDCLVRSVYPGGDHAVVLGEVVACAELWPRPPLVFYGSDFVAVGDGGVGGHWPVPGEVATGSSVLSTSDSEAAVTTRRNGTTSTADMTAKTPNAT
jgi:3-hydroxy-9,10-secoandrosta-1,3,5(10)-triene-9,17-dione monooxygenase reductase component